jgi:hypothetical protein
MEFIRKITAGLKRDNVQKYLGAAYRPLLEAHLKTFEVCTFISVTNEFMTYD